MVEQALTETALPPYKSRVDQWVDEVREYQASSQEPKSRTDKLLGQGYQLFFEILEPLKNEEWLSSENPNLEKGIYVRTNDPRLRRFDRELFAGDSIRYQDEWKVNIYNHYKSSDEKAQLLIANAAHGSRGEKAIEIILKPYYHSGLKGDMVYDERFNSYVRAFKGGNIDITQDKRLSDYPALTVCKLAVSLAQIYTEETLRKMQSAQAS